PFKINGDTVEKTAAPSRRSFTAAFGEYLTGLAEKDDKIIAITSAMCDGTGLMDFSKKYPDRFYDVGIAESAAVDIAAGMARDGLKPVVCIYSTFLQRSFDHIFQEVALQNLPVVFCIDRAGFVGSDGPTHHGLMDIGYMRMMPNLVLMAPANELETKLALEFALSADKPVVIRYPKDAVPAEEFVLAACSEPFELGRSVTVKRSKGSSLAIVSYGAVLSEALRAAAILAEKKAPVDVINARFAAPVDENLGALLKRGKKILTVEDHFVACGFGSAVLELAAAEGCPACSVRLLGAPSKFIGHNSRQAQLMEAGVDAESIAETIGQMLRA
ncbi:MAG: hypothetical protein JSW59_20810, partial [Phycisphaerales bacterium]